MQKSAEQLEIFSKENDYAPKRQRSIRQAFLSQMRSYEKILLFLMVLLVTGLVSFSLGVEKGKRIGIAVQDINLRAYVPAQMPPVSTQATTEKLPAPALTAPAPVKEGPKPFGNFYTVQVASYKTKTSALKEAERLKNKGFSSTIVTKGNFVILCVGNYPNKEKAMLSLRELKKNYPDCIIRRL